MNYNSKILLFTMLIAIFAADFFLLTGCGSDDFSDELVFTETLQTRTVTEPLETEDNTVIYVYVCGQVKSPGVYELLPNDRIIDAVKAAGGVTDTAAADRLNLAAFVTDGDKIYVPDMSETINQTGEDTSGLVNVNTADVSELMTLPGIGEAKATSIIQYREGHGAFSSIESLQEVPGIKSGVYEQIKALITVG